MKKHDLLEIICDHADFNPAFYKLSEAKQDAIIDNVLSDQELTKTIEKCVDILIAKYIQDKQQLASSLDPFF